MRKIVYLFNDDILLIFMCAQQMQDVGAFQGNIYLFQVYFVSHGIKMLAVCLKRGVADEMAMRVCCTRSVTGLRCFYNFYVEWMVKRVHMSALSILMVNSIKRCALKMRGFCRGSGCRAELKVSTYYYLCINILYTGNCI